ncbi:hypothetical protein HHI36_005076 [Cryptolaemus montrouzieri]|uniref:MADF domain-containing protein n=1 Tax=Cryptolaemus montrouzieri TaxID=559131 RepID=A0ABD2NT19_9CUCU
MYRASPRLQDSTNQYYKNKNLRHDNLLELAVSFGVDKQEIYRKIKTLQSHFMRKRIKETDSKKTGTGEEKHYKKHASTPPPSNTSLKAAKTKEFRSPKAFKTKSGKPTFMTDPGSSNAPLLDEVVNLMKSIQSKRADIKDEDSFYESFNQILFDAEKGMYELHDRPNKAAFSGLLQFLSNPPMSLVPVPWQFPAASVNAKPTERSPGYSQSLLTSQSQLPLTSPMSFAPVPWQSRTAPVNTNPTEFSPGYS